MTPTHKLTPAKSLMPFKEKESSKKEIKLRFMTWIKICRDTIVTNNIWEKLCNKCIISVGNFLPHWREVFWIFNPYQKFNQWIIQKVGIYYRYHFIITSILWMIKCYNLEVLSTNQYSRIICELRIRILCV